MLRRTRTRLTQVASMAPMSSNMSYSMQDNCRRDAGIHDRAPRDGVDFEYTGDPQTVLPGTHPLPLTAADVMSTRWPLVSPFVPAPGRVHPYWTAPPSEFPHFGASVPIVYSWGLVKERIVAPVFDTRTGAIAHTRELDPFVFGAWPDQMVLDENSTYWQLRTTNYAKMWELGRYEIFRKSKKNWANTGTGMGRVSDRKNAMYPWGGRKNPTKPWNMQMPKAQPYAWQYACRMALTLKMLQGKLMVVDRLHLETPTKGAFLELCERMQWDVRHDGAGVLFMDGGSRLSPSVEFEPSFFYGSFYNGRCKLVRPIITVDKPYDWNFPVQHQTYEGPKGQKNPVPLNRFNTYDALDHHLLVITEGALSQIEQEVEDLKLRQLPPHILNQMHERGMISSHLTGASGDATMAPLQAIEREAAGRVEEAEKKMYDGYYDNPYEPHADEQFAAYEVDAVDGFIKRHTVGSKKGAGAAAGTVPGSWRQLS